MSTVSYDVFLPEVMQYCPDVPELLATNAIKQACIEFCEKTRYWQVDLDPQMVYAGQSSCSIDTPSGTKLVSVIEAWFNGVLLIPKSTEELTRMYRFTDWRALVSSPLYITQIIPSEIMLVPAPLVNNSSGLTMRVALAPTRASTGVDQDIYESYLEYISYGARARLYGTPKQPYFDKPSSIEYERKFLEAISSVRTNINKGLSRSAVQVEFARFV